MVDQNSLVPSNQGQMDPISFFLYLLVLPLRIMAQVLRSSPFPFPQQGAPGAGNPPRTDFPRVIDAPSYSVGPPQQPASTYLNEETWEVEWSSEGLPTRITVHRNAQRT